MKFNLMNAEKLTSDSADPDKTAYSTCLLCSLARTSDSVVTKTESLGDAD
jgi:hypothetical protein